MGVFEGGSVLSWQCSACIRFLMSMSYIHKHAVQLEQPYATIVVHMLRIDAVGHLPLGHSGVLMCMERLLDPDAGKSIRTYI